MSREVGELRAKAERIRRMRLRFQDEAQSYREMASDRERLARELTNKLVELEAMIAELTGSAAPFP